MGLGISEFAFAGAVFEMLTAAATVMALRGSYTSSTFKLRNEHDQGTPAYVNPMLTLSVVYTEGARGYATIDFGDDNAHGNICFVISGSSGQVGVGTLNENMAAKLHVTSTSTSQVTLIVQQKARPDSRFAAVEKCYSKCNCKDQYPRCFLSGSGSYGFRSHLCQGWYVFRYYS